MFNRAQSITDSDDNDTAENIAIDELKTSIQGTLLVVNGSCPHGHEVYWQSQPTVKNMGAGNLLLPAAILFSGLTFTSFANMLAYLMYP